MQHAGVVVRLSAVGGVATLPFIWSPYRDAGNSAVTPRMLDLIEHAKQQTGMAIVRRLRASVPADAVERLVEAWHSLGAPLRACAAGARPTERSHARASSQRTSRPPLATWSPRQVCAQLQGAQRQRLRLTLRARGHSSGDEAAHFVVTTLRRMSILPDVRFHHISLSGLLRNHSLRCAAGAEGDGPGQCDLPYADPSDPVNFTSVALHTQMQLAHAAPDAENKALESWLGSLPDPSEDLARFEDEENRDIDALSRGDDPDVPLDKLLGSEQGAKGAAGPESGQPSAPEDSHERYAAGSLIAL